MIYLKKMYVRGVKIPQTEPRAKIPVLTSPNSPRRNEYNIILVILLKPRHLMRWGEGEQSWAQIREWWYVPRENNS